LQYQREFAQVVEQVQRFNAMLRERDIPNIFLPKRGAVAVAAGSDQ